VHLDIIKVIYSPMGFTAISFLSMSRGMACCIKPQPGGPGDF
jgi:hypothetical protein